MYTRCPECRTWFSVTEAHLAAARARVRCGQCRATFDASTRLWSEPDEQSAPVPWNAAGGESTAKEAAGGAPAAAAPAAADPVFGPGTTEPSEPYLADDSFETHGDPFDTLEYDYPRPQDPLEDGPIISTVSLEEVDLEAELEADAPGPLVGDVHRVTAEGSRIRPGADRIHEGRVSARRRKSREQEILSRIEGMDVRRGRRLAANSCVVLLFLLVLQYVWFMAGDLSAAFPVLGPALDDFCAVAGCETNQRSREEGIRVVSRTVRPHPEYTSAFSVKATIENRATEARPYPVVVFVLYGQDGQTLASRAFKPAEYLENGAEPDNGMESGSRTDIAFDLVAPSEVAVSFDLRLI